MITKEEVLNRVRDVIDATLSTVDNEGNPQSRIIDMMHIDEDTVYFLTARGKHVYQEIIEHPQISILSLNENKSIRITGTAKKLDDQKKWIDLMFDENKFLNNVYPEDARYILEPFKIVEGSIEFFDLTQKPIFRTSFTIGDGKIKEKGFIITENCISCSTCANKCPQKAIESGTPYKIQQEHCLHCGICFEGCPVEAINKI